MDCSFCNLPAEAKCANSLLYMCQSHLIPGSSAMKNYISESLDFNIENSRLLKLRSKIPEEINKINKFKIEITIKTKKIINTIIRGCKQSIEKLNAINNIYSGLLRQNKFTKSDMETMIKIENKDLKLIKKYIENIQRQIEFNFSQEFFKYEENLDNLRIKFLDKHAGGFFCATVIGDGNMLVTGGTDSVIRVWSIVKNKQEFALHGHYGLIRCLTVSADSQNIISGSVDASIRIWSIQKKTQENIFKGHKNAIVAVCYLERSSSVISSDIGSRIIIWDLRKLTIIKVINELAGVNCLILTKDQYYLIAGLNPMIVFYELVSCRIVKTFNRHSSAVRTISLAANEKIIVSGSSDCSIIIWDSNQLSIISKLSGHTGIINSLALSLDDKFIVSGSTDKTVRVWSMETGTHIKTLNHAHYVFCILNIRNIFFSFSEDSGIGQLDIDARKFGIDFILKPFLNQSMTFEIESGLVAYGSKNEVFIWDRKTNKKKITLFGHQSMVNYVEISRDCQFVISCSSDYDNNLIYWNLRTGKKIAELKGHKTTVSCVCFSEDGLSAASGSLDNTIRKWNLIKTKKEFKFELESYALSIKFSDSKRFLVSAGCDKKVIIWNLQDGSKYAELGGHNYKIFKVHVTEDEKFIISGDEHEGIRVWNVDEKRQEFIFGYYEEAIGFFNKNGITVDLFKRFLKA